MKVKKKKVKPLDHIDPKSFSWKLMNYAISVLVCDDINIFLADVGLEISGKRNSFWCFVVEMPDSTVSVVLSPK